MVKQLIYVVLFIFIYLFIFVVFIKIGQYIDRKLSERDTEGMVSGRVAPNVRQPKLFGRK